MKIKPLTLFACVRLEQALYQLSAYPRRGLIKLLTLFSVLLASNQASAADDIAGMVNSVLGGVTSLKTPLINASAVAGVILIVSALAMMISKKNNPHIKAWHIVLAFVVGFSLIGIVQLVQRGQRQMDLNPVSVG